MVFLRYESGDVQKVGDNLGLEFRKIVRLDILIWKFKYIGDSGSYESVGDILFQESIYREEMSKWEGKGREQSLVGLRIEEGGYLEWEDKGNVVKENEQE